MMLASTSGPAAHFVLEALAYVLGARAYWRAAGQDSVADRADRLLLLGSAIVGALLGSKLLHVGEHFGYLVAQSKPELWLAGKSVLGGFLGGTLATEIAKRSIGWRRPTGDAWVPALAVGLIVGRLGCQLSGTWDQTYGIPNDLPWAWDYGDGIGRHPTALYEIVLVAAAYGISRQRALTTHAGARFALFLLLYCLIRLGLEFLKPPFGAAAPDSPDVDLHGGLTAIQWAALFGTAWFGALLRKRLAAPMESPS